MPTARKILGAEHGILEGKIYEWTTSIARLGVVEISFGASENYATGGIDVATSITGLFPDIQEILGAAVLFHDVGGWVPRYDVPTGRILFYGQQPTSTTSGVIPLDEMPNASTAINNKKVRLLVVGV